MKSLLCLIAPFLIVLLFGISASSLAQSAPGKDTAIVESDSTARTGKDYDKTFIKVEIESEFPGGASAWLNFLQQNLRYPKKAIRKNIQGTVIMQFIVGRDGSISNISAISGDPILEAAALEVMLKSPNWTPAYQKGRAVKSYKRQPIVFRLE